RNDGDVLDNLLLDNYKWQYLDKLVLLLQSFAQSITFIESSQYLTMGMMYPTIYKLILHLDDISIKLTTSKIQDICEIMNDSILNHWDEPKEIELIASYLDPCFKNLHFLSPSKKIETVNLLRTKIANLSDLSTFTTSNIPTQDTHKHMMS
ncbi:21923_t:CDS:1, partial [Dentiscutata erythropus]